MAKSKRKFRFRLFLWINQFFVFLLLLTYISPYIPPQVFWPLSVFGLAYPILLLVNVLFIVFWLLLVNKNLIYSILAIAIGWSTLSSHFQLKGEDKNPIEQGLKVVSFNVKNLSNNNEKYADIKIRTSIQNYLDEQEAQLICLQEFQTYPSKGIHTVKQFKERLKMPYAAETRYVPKSKFKFVDLMVTFSKYPIIKQQDLRYQDKCYTLITDISYQKDTIRLFNIHLESNHLAQKEYEIFSSSEVGLNEETGGQVAVLLDKLARYSKIRNTQVNHINELIKKSPHPVLICGDFNDTPASYAYQKLSKNLNDAFVKKGKGYGNTYNGKLPAMRIDYILSDTLFQVHQFKIGKIDKSDHYPVISTLSLTTDK
jgi:endonuclease/exonuclease/phosphatase family metal-dependent hydrolase